MSGAGWKVDVSFSVERRGGQVDHSCRSARDRLQWAKNDYVAAEQAYATHLKDLNWLTNFHQLHGVPDANQSAFASSAFGSPTRDANWELKELDAEVGHLEKFSKSLRTDQELIRSALAKQGAARLAALKQRSVMLLHANIAEQLTFE